MEALYPPVVIYELRYYAMNPGARDTLIALFEREFLETQEEVGMEVPGQFRDLDAPDTFPWIRGFPDMEARRVSLEAFYYGPVWKAHRDAANATLADSDNVLLLKPVTGAFTRSSRTAPPTEAVYLATICPVVSGFTEYFVRELAPALNPMASFETEHAENTFPRLPVREGENVFVWFNRFDRVEDCRLPDLDGLGDWLTGPPTHLRLAPTARSALR